MKITKTDILKAIIMSLIPLFACVFTMLLCKSSLSEVYLPASDNIVYNDEIMYYQMVNTDISGAADKGYFGYNESQAEIGNHYAWSPARQLNWVILGKIFGWNANSLWQYNIIMMMLAFGLMGLLMKPSKETILYCFLGCGFFLGMTRNILSGMSEVSTYVYLMIFLGYTIKWNNEEQVGFADAIISYMLIILLFLMRPYYILLLGIYVYFNFLYGNKKRTAIISVVSVPLIIWLYELFNKSMVARINGKAVGSSSSALLEDGLINKAVAIAKVFVKSAIHLIDAIKSAVTPGDTSLYIAYYITVFAIIVLLFEVIYLQRKKLITKKNSVLLKSWLAVMMLTYVLSIFTCNIDVVFRHNVYAFIVLTVLLAQMDLKVIKNIFAINCAITLLLTVKVINNVENIIPVYDSQKEDSLNELKSIMTAEIEMESVNGWDNTIDWVLEDTDKNGEYVNTDYTYLYGMPMKMGVNLCNNYFIKENLSSLKAKYVYLYKGGELEQFLLENNKEEIYSNDLICVYRLR